MANDDRNVPRTLHLKVTLPTADAAQLLSLVQAATPFVELFGGKQVRLLQNVDDPAKFIQVIEYETPEVVEINRQRIASDPRLQSYIQAWRALIPGSMEVDVYRDVKA